MQESFKDVRAVIGQCVEQCRGDCRLDNSCDVDILRDEPMSAHTTFKVGGPADFYIRPKDCCFPRFCSFLLSLARAEKIPVFILGGGANIVVSDRGVRGIVLDTGGWNGGSVTEDGLVFKSGTSIDEAAEFAASRALCGLEFLAGMPGSIGGAVWMNARCYGSEIADVLSWTEIIDNEQMTDNGEPVIKRIATGQGEGNGFGYKRSPFQGKDALILCACFKLKPGDENEIRSQMEKNRRDRQEKGHYRFPCAGSAFKNNHAFGKPTGQIIDELGLRGFQIGGAQVAPFHGNIVINAGNATAKDIRALMDEVAEKVKAATGFVLEPEILFAGDW